MIKNTIDNTLTFTPALVFSNETPIVADNVNKNHNPQPIANKIFVSSIDDRL